MDGEKFDIEVHKEDMEGFIASFGKGEVYFNPKRGVGVWIPLDKIRNFKVEHVDEWGKRIKEGDRGVHGQDGGVKRRTRKGKEKRASSVGSPVQSVECGKALGTERVDLEATETIKKEEIEKLDNILREANAGA